LHGWILQSRCFQSQYHFLKLIKCLNDQNYSYLWCLSFSNYLIKFKGSVKFKMQSIVNINIGGNGNYKNGIIESTI